MQRLAYPLLALIWAAIFIPLFIGSPSVDLTALYVAGYAVSQDMPQAVYALHPDFLSPEVPAVLADLKAQIGLAGHPTVPYIYPPLWAWLMSPIVEHVRHETFAQSAMILHIALLAASVGLAWKVVRPPHLKFEHWLVLGFVILSFSAPARQALLQNQPQILTMFLVLLAFERYRANHFAAAGVVLAVAAAFKLSPVFLLLIFVLDRNWRATVAFLLTGAALGLLSILLAGWPLHARFLAILGKIDSLTILEKTNYAPELLIYQISSLVTAQDNSGWNMGLTVTAPEPFWLSALMAAFMLAAIAALILMRARLVPGTATPVLLLGFALATALFGPISWAHYFLLPLLLLPTLFHLFSPANAWRWIVPLVLLQSFPAYIAYFKLSSAFYVTTLMGVVCFGTLLALLVFAVFRAVRFEPDVPLHFR